MAAERKCAVFKREAEQLLDVRREIRQFHVAQHQSEVVVLQPMHIALPLHPELTHIVEQSIQMDGVIARQCEIIRCDADVGDFIDERIRQGMVLIFQVDLVNSKILDAYDECLAILHLLDGGGYRVDDFLEDRGVAMIHMTEEKIEVRGAIRIDDISRPDAGDL